MVGRRDNWGRAPWLLGGDRRPWSKVEGGGVIKYARNRKILQSSS